MPQPILNPPPSTDYQEIRDTIEPGLSSSVLPDAVVGRSVYEGRAEADVLAVDPLAYTRTDANQILRLRLAVILLTAAYIRESYQPLWRERVGPYEYSRLRQDPLEAANVLKQEAYAQLALYADLIGIDLRPTAMALAENSRGDLHNTVDPIESGVNGTPLLGWP